MTPLVPSTPHQSVECKCLSQDDDPAANPGSKAAALASEVAAGHEALGGPVTTVTLPDLLSLAPAPAYIIKLDIQGWDCQV